jgi:thiol-disulfide isomerase/thioredoxin
MKKIVVIVFVISLLANGYFIYDQKTIDRYESESKMFSNAFGGEVNNTKWKDGFSLFKKKLFEQDSSMINKKYFYINVWNTICNPCIKEMPMLDSIAGAIEVKNISYIFVSDNTNGAALKRLKGKFEIKHFIYLNDMNDFVSAVLNEKGKRHKTYPMQLILDQTGKLYYYQEGAFENPKEAGELVKAINSLE